MIAWKFLAAGAVAPFTGVRWPAPGAWLAGPPDRPDAWIRACRAGDLPHWIDRELWSVELDAPVRAERYQVASPRARLLARVEAWNAALARDYASACALRARDLALPHVPAAIRDAVADASEPATVAEAAKAGRGDRAAGYVRDAAVFVKDGPAVVSYVAATLASFVGGGLAAFEAERAWQARWLAERLGIPGAPS